MMNPIVFCAHTLQARHRRLSWWPLVYVLLTAYRGHSSCFPGFLWLGRQVPSGLWAFGPAQDGGQALPLPQRPAVLLSA